MLIVAFFSIFCLVLFSCLSVGWDVSGRMPQFLISTVLYCPYVIVVANRLAVSTVCVFVRIATCCPAMAILNGHMRFFSIDNSRVRTRQ